MISQRQKCVKITDRRVRLTTEVLQGIRLIKAYGWEAFYAHHITNLREQEISRIKKSSIAAALLISTFYFLPVIANVIAFITYGLTGHQLTIAKIFTALQLFNAMRVPLLLFPLVLSSLADAMVAFQRICSFLTAEELAETYVIDPSQPQALYVDGDFEWETTLKLQATSEEADIPAAEKLRKEAEKKAAEKKAEKQKKKEAKLKAKSKQLDDKNPDAADNGAGEGLPSTADDVAQDKDAKEDEKPFALEDLHLDVKKGAFVAIVGRVGSGKSSILQAVIGEMRRTRGKVVFNDRMAYFPQSPWIKNATVRENILFGQAYDEKRFHEVIHACGLEHDLQVLSHGENTEIGEKGINLSGGQKARISLARAAYSTAEIVLLDDPLSAVDAHVGKHVLENCFLQGPLANRTRILVTHSLHILDKTDYIYVMDNGKIVEEGTYTDLCSGGAAFSRLIEEHGHVESGTQSSSAKVSKNLQVIKKNDSTTATALMEDEERNVGAVTWDVYKKYLRNAGGLIWAPILLVLLVLVEGNNVFTTLFLGFWSGQTIHGFTQGQYMGVYGGLGAALSVSTFLLTYAFMVAGLVASLSLYRGALAGVLNSRVSFFDTTPIGRILSRLSKDQDTIDSTLPHIIMQFLVTFFSVIGTVGLVFYTFPYLGIIFLPLAVLYYGASIYYRRSSVETKRLDSLMRSILYGSYTETLTGLPTIRAYGMQTRSIKDAEHGLNMENRAYLMTVLSQRWLALRLEFFANALVLGIGLFGAGFRNTVNPAKISVVLSYTLGATQIFSEMISLFAQSEQNMNAVERILHYVELLPEESDSDAPIEAPKSWPTKGSISVQDLKLAYREGLPIVLKGISFDVKAGEKVGIVGRTGSGKSSIIQALLRMVEAQGGKIEIDGVDISTVGLHTLRTSIAFVPQDTTLFLGTLRDNLDPEKLRTDAELISILQQAWLLPKEGPIDPAVEAKFSLDSTVGDEGSNYSAGEKQLLALCRALVKKSRIIILDEATSSVDVETDSKIQKTIQAEFADSTLLCIAHRLNTIVHYDRILVMDDGKVAEFDSVLTLFDRPDSLFRSLCNEAQLTRADITKLRAEHASH
ncbi:P-loop containing nucleoside triphosphate hydrolase protein [Pholiota conissans]|uniref:P-loop containing nucleoside triphosphate hydrolase protein n=1 Tax=Pholiota conissans TaxID=109636 RepID=A0A9P5YPS6_9AGAR|nr:P-loop containing nucleoside triphosphate hydrolase protein [Pholiota conissans]